MSTAPQSGGTANVPNTIFVEYLAAMEAAGFPPAKVAALRKTLLEMPDFSENAIRQALMAEESVP